MILGPRESGRWRKGELSVADGMKEGRWWIRIKSIMCWVGRKRERRELKWLARGEQSFHCGVQTLLAENLAVDFLRRFN